MSTGGSDWKLRKCTEPSRTVTRLIWNGKRSRTVLRQSASFPDCDSSPVSAATKLSSGRSSHTSPTSEPSKSARHSIERSTFGTRTNGTGTLPFCFTMSTFSIV